VQILTSVQRLATFPMSGRSGRVPGTRQLVVPNMPFIAAYAIDEERIVILASVTVHNTGRRFSKYRHLLPTTQFIRRRRIGDRVNWTPG
jgi:plasmid stabilization system protein ParE